MPGLLVRALFVMACIVLAGGCALQKKPGARTKTGHPRVALAENAAYLSFSGFRSAGVSRMFDLSSLGLKTWLEYDIPLRHSLSYAMAQPQNGYAIKRRDISLTWKQIGMSLAEMIELLPRLDRNPELLAENFVWFALSPDPLTTSYYTPEVEASLRPSPGYHFPIYGVPPDLKKNRHLYDRRSVDMDRVLAGKGLEIAWAKDAVDVFYMQVEGAGRLKLPDGRVKTAIYGGANGHKFKGLGAIMHDKGLLPYSRLDKKSVQDYLNRHPDKMFELMAENRSYVFFRLSDSGAEGAIGRPLTPMISVATDRKLIPLGGILAMELKILGGPGGGIRHIRGVCLAQDTGAAIRGTRLDYYLGVGDEVEWTAHRVKSPARVYMLISKKALGR